jgi:head-tail adaptor
MVHRRVKHSTYNIAQILAVRYQSDLTHNLRINKKATSISIKSQAKPPQK